MKFDNDFEFTVDMGKEAHKAMVLTHWGALLVYIMSASIGLTCMITVLLHIVGPIYMLMSGLCFGYMLFSFSTRRSIYKKRVKEIEELCGKAGKIRMRHTIERDIRTFQGYKKVPAMVTKFDGIKTWIQTKNLIVVTTKDNNQLIFKRDAFKVGTEEDFKDFLDAKIKKYKK